MIETGLTAIVAVVVIGFILVMNARIKRQRVEDVKQWTQVLRNHLDMPEEKRSSVWEIEAAMAARTLMETMEGVDDAAVRMEANVEVRRVGRLMGAL